MNKTPGQTGLKRWQIGILALPVLAILLNLVSWPKAFIAAITFPFTLTLNLGGSQSLILKYPLVCHVAVPLLIVQALSAVLIARHTKFKTLLSILLVMSSLILTATIFLCPAFVTILMALQPSH